MDIKKTQQTSSVEAPVRSQRKAQDFVAEMKSEIHKIHWTSKEELFTYAQIVAISTLAFGLSIYMMDLVIQGVLGSLNFLLRLIAG